MVCNFFRRNENQVGYKEKTERMRITRLPRRFSNSYVYCTPRANKASNSAAQQDHVGAASLFSGTVERVCETALCTLIE